MQEAYAPGAGWNPGMPVALSVDHAIPDTESLPIRGRTGAQLAAGALLYAFDEPIYEEIERSRTRGVWREVEDIGETFDHLALMGETAKFYVVGMIGGHVLDATTGRDGPRLYERVSSGKHWASDSLLGAAWGWGVARLVIGRREADRTDFVPAIRP